VVLTQVFGARRVASPSRVTTYLRLAILGAAAAALLAPPAPAAAQGTVFVGKGNPGDVIIDFGALDQLGPPPHKAPPHKARRAPAAKASGEAEAPVVLTPPGAKAPKKTAQTAKKPAKKPVHTAKKTEESAVKQAETAKAKKKPATAKTEATAEKMAPPAPPASVTQAPLAPPAGTTTAAAVPAASGKSATASAADGAAPPQPPAPPSSAVTAPPQAPSSPAPAAASAPSPGPAASIPSFGPPTGKTAAATPPAPPASKPSAGKPETGAAASAESRGDRSLSVNFDSGSADLNSGAKSGLDKVIESMKKDAALRLQLVAFAAGSEDQASQARRLSLSRALAVRSYLIEQGISSTRMDVRALGNKVEGGGPPDRVDLMMVGK
jgi:outer membrane protein OmpA-like peptidoglycan-associated protein